MIKIWLLFLIFETVTGEIPAIHSFPRKNIVYNSTYDYNTTISVFVNNETEQIMDFVESDEGVGYPTRVQVAIHDAVSLEYPVFITATQQKGVSAWELPLLVQSKRHELTFNSMARTLCPHDAGSDVTSEKRPTIHISTDNPRNTSVSISLGRVEDFYVALDKNLTFEVGPNTPRYYFFSFDQNPWNVTKNSGSGLPIFNYTIPKSVILVIDSADEICATVSIQDNSCPVFDNEKEISYQGYHLTMTSKGGITLTQTMFPNGFYVVFIVKENDDACTGTSETDIPSDKDRKKTFTFLVVATVSYTEYVVGALLLLATLLLAAAFVVLVALPFRHVQEEELLIEDPGPSTSREDARIINDADVTDVTGVTEAGDGDAWSRSEALTVGKLSRAPPDTLARRSDRYFWGALTLAVVYALPVVQLLFTYQQMVFATGNQDLCYYNFLCAHPLGPLSDSNHVFSNLGYVLLGLVFLLQVRARQRAGPDLQDMGIPQHYGLLYSMGLALVMEGFLSACYHLCPNKMNFQFDSSFMYVIAVLVMIKLYQNRHSDLIPSAHSTFMLIAFFMSIGMVGILFPSAGFSVLFTALHMAACLVLTLKIYYAGSFKMERGVVRRAAGRVSARGLRALRPAHGARALLLALANLANWALAIYSAVERNEDFARQLLGILLGNALLYTLFYVCMKLVHRERILPHTWVYIVGAHVAWFVALSQFVNGNTRWSETPAQSRRHNAGCGLLALLDAHDAWHAASAAALHLSFSMLLTVDDGLRATPRDRIATF